MGFTVCEFGLVIISEQIIGCINSNSKISLDSRYKHYPFPSQETVLQELDLKHLEERELVLRLADHAPNTDLFSTSAQTNEVNQKMILMDLMEERRQLREGTSFTESEQQTLLQVSKCGVFESIRMQLGAKILTSSQESCSFGR